MTFLVESLPLRVRQATLNLGFARTEQDRVPRRLAELLTRPLFDLNGQPAHETAIVPDAAVIEAVDFADIERKEPKPNWTLEGVLQLHSVLLEESLSALAARGNGEQKREILEWIFEPDFVGTVIRHGREMPVFTSQIPWAFAFCCKLERMNPEAIRQHIRHHMPVQVRQFFH